MRSTWKRFASILLTFMLFLGLLPALTPAAQASAIEDLTKWQVTNNALTASQSGSYSFVGLAKQGSARQYNKLISPASYEGNMHSNHMCLH